MVFLAAIASTSQLPGRSKWLWCSAASDSLSDSVAGVMIVPTGFAICGGGGRLATGLVGHVVIPPPGNEEEGGGEGGRHSST